MVNPDKLGSFLNASDEYEKFDFAIVMRDAFSMLGYCYENGLGVSKDLDKATAYFEFFGGYSENPEKKICEMIKTLLQKYVNPTLKEYVGECGGQFYDGLMSISGDNPYNTRPWRNIGVLYLKRNNFARAKEELIVESPHTTSNGWISCQSPIQYLWAGEMYFKGLGVPQDYNKAFHYFDIVVNNNILTDTYDTFNAYPEFYADACYRLYQCYSYGYGVETNKQKAQFYFKEALRNGSTSALYDSQKRYEVLGN